MSNSIFSFVYRLLYTGTVRIRIRTLTRVCGGAALVYLLYKLFYYLTKKSYPNQQSMQAGAKKNNYNILVIVKAVLLRDGRALAYEQVGNATSKCIIFFHSLGSSRLEIYPQEEALAKQYDLRCLHIDRPGYGRSSTHHNRNLETFAQDMLQFVTTLQIEKFAIIGVGAGCPYALATASLLEREKNKSLVAVSLLSPSLPYADLPRMEFSPYLKDVWFLTMHIPFLLQLFLRLELYNTVFIEPEQYSHVLLQDQSKYYTFEERELAEYVKHVVKWFREGMSANGVQEVLVELKLERSKWGKSILSQLKHIPIHLWCGKKDKLVPCLLVRKFADQMLTKYNHTNVHMHEVAKKGHLFYFNEQAFQDVLVTMLQYMEDAT